MLAFVEGVGSLIFLTFLAYCEKFSRRNKKTLTASEEDNASHELWSLTTDNQEFKHNFLSLSDDVQLHYLTPISQHERRRRLIIFIHGFPDSCHLWTHMFRTSLRKHANLVSLDLPGYGGSCSLPRYGPDEVLTTVSSAIRELRRRYGVDVATEEQGSGECIVVGHDWGGIIASRIAAATDGLIDHLVLANTAFPSHFASRLMAYCRNVILPFKTKPDGVNLQQAIYLAINSARCIATQLLKSHYICAFNLPFFTTARFPSAMRYLLTYCHRKAPLDIPRPPGWHHATSQGPLVAQCQETEVGQSYDPSVLIRAMQQPDKIWDERICLYREGVISKPWKSGSSADRASEVVLRVDQTKIPCRTTVIFGLGDQSIDPRMAVEGIDDHVHPRDGPKGQVFLLEGVGHWSPLHPSCVAVLEAVLSRTRGEASLPSSGLDAIGKDLKARAESGKVHVRDMR